jgi:hypothetical protein
MVGIFPGGIFTLQKPKQPSPPNLVARGFHQKGTASTRPDQGVDFED